MHQRNAMIAAAALTAFVLVLIAGLATRLTQTADLAANSSPTTSVAADPATATLDPAVEALIREREATYQAALAEANSRLEAANAQIAAANQQLAQAAANQQLQGQIVHAPIANKQAPAAANPVKPAPTYAFSKDQALAAALAAAPGSTLLKAPELVRYQGAIAYEVQLDRGLVYIDAQSGAILNNGASSGGPINRDQAIQAAQAYLGGGEIVQAELVDERGLRAYKVEFVDGSIVYVEASTGQVAYATIQGAGGEHDGEGHDENGEHDD